MATLQIPLAIWKGSVELDVTCTLARPEEGWLFLGLRTGRILRIELDIKTKQIRLAMLLIGHRNPVVSLAVSLQRGDQSLSPIPTLLSLDQGGEAALWSIDDGRCLLHNVLAIDGEARGLVVGPRSEHAFVYGHSAFVNILRVSTLEVIQTVPLPPTFWVASAVVIDKSLTDDQILRVERDDNIEVILFSVEGQNVLKFIFDERSGKAQSGASPVPVIYGGHGTPPPPSKMNVTKCIRVGVALYFMDESACWVGQFKGNELIIHLLWANSPDQVINIVALEKAPLILIEMRSGIMVIFSGGIFKPQKFLPPYQMEDDIMCRKALIPWECKSENETQIGFFMQLQFSPNRIILRSIEEEWIIVGTLIDSIVSVDLRVT